MEKRNLRMYVEEVSNDGSEFQLVFEIDGKIKDIKTGYCIDDILFESYNFFNKNCEKYNFDSRFDNLSIELNYKMGV